MGTHRTSRIGAASAIRHALHESPERIVASKKAIARLSIYRRSLQRELARGEKFVCSYDLAKETGVSAAQVRRDIMLLGYSGSPNRGYDAVELIRSIGRYLDDPEGQKVAIVGLGDLGRAVVTFVARNRPGFSVIAAFDHDPAKVGMNVRGCRCYSVDDLPEVVARLGICVGIIAVPVHSAQEAADQLIAAGVTGLVNFAPIALSVPEHVHVESHDLITALERAAYFAKPASSGQSA